MLGPSSTTITCGSASSTVNLGAVDEGYTGDVELVSGIPAGTSVRLELDIYPEHLQFLELNFTSGETTVTVRTKKPLDAEANIFFTPERILHYSLVCNNDVTYKNSRRLIINDINDNSPVFEKKFYSQNVSESEVVNTEVLRVRAVDADITPEFSTLTYSYTPVTPDFSLSNSGAFTLMNPLNYSIVPKYNFIVTARDNGGNYDTTSVEIVVDIDNLNPFFSHSLYQAVILENQDGDLSEIRPEPIKAQDGDTGINMTITYSITSVSPVEYQANFNIDADTGVLTVVTSFDREEMDRGEISVNIKAAQTDDPLKTADAVVSVTVEDMNDNAPEFDRPSYNATVLKNSFTNTITDLDQIITTISVSITDDDNKPEFSSSSYETSTVEKRKPVLVLRATDKDTGNNSLITYSFSEGHSPYLALDSETGEVTLTSDLTDVTEDTTLVLTAEATDHGKPPHSTTARVVVNIRNASLVDRVVFLSSSYNFKLKENQNSGAFVGQVQASAGSDLYEVSYELRTHKDLFSIHSNGSIVSTKELDKEEQEWYFLDVEAVDTRTPPTSAVAPVRIQVEDVNEPPAFSSDDYEASVFSIAPYKTPVIQVKASDPDVRDNCVLVYSLSGESSSFDVEPASGLLYVVSVADLGGKTVSMEVKATDSGELSATTTVKVVVQGSASSSDVTIISLNKPANTVERKVPEVEEALGKTLGWTVNIIQVSSSGGEGSRTLRESVRTLVSFIALDGDKAVETQEVTKKLQSQSEEVRAELAKVLGNDVQFQVETGKDPPGISSDRITIIVLGILAGLALVGLILTVSVFKRKIQHIEERRKSLSLQLEM
ncbi:protocadherin-like wing polarity protein stan [Poecilia latipinna]|uniref:protocadherin-like wing polarity protein stan n=1 Tax=Poecilia latipinna TaxID=48699 RepID=UPI00072DD3DA|nr:PREDICTED: protocadherin-like wing polarity protein stan [Poecilia latipinna]